MKGHKTDTGSGKATAGLVSVIGLLFVWTIVWANFPSLQDFSTQSKLTPLSTPPELDLTIPGSPIRLMDQSAGTGEAVSSEAVGELSAPANGRARQIAEMRCDAQLQQFCPDSLTGEARRRCVMQRMSQLDQPCQQIARQRVVRWKEVDGYKLSCVEDAKRVCQDVSPGDGRILQCLQEHEQDLSERCYRSLPKGRLHLQN